MTFDDVRHLILAWPGVEDGVSYGTPALKVGGKLLTRVREDGDSLVVKDVGYDERDLLLAAEPEVFFITEHYRFWPTVLIRLSKARPETVQQFLFRRWQAIAPKKLVRAFPGPPPL